MYERFFIKRGEDFVEVFIVREFYVSSNQSSSTKYLVRDEKDNSFSIYPDEIKKIKKVDFGTLGVPDGRYRIGLPEEPSGNDNKEYSLIYDYQEQVYYVGNIGIGMVDWCVEKKDAEMLTHDSAKIALTMLESICGKSFLRIIKVDKDKNEIE